MANTNPIIHKKRGPKPKVVDEKLIFNLAKIHCTQNEISVICGISVDTLHNKYSDVIKRGDEEGKMSLRRKLHDLADKGNVGVLIWLSKQRLGYRDKAPEEVASISFNIKINEVPK